jgi:hypothetical protein
MTLRLRGLIFALVGFFVLAYGGASAQVAPFTGFGLAQTTSTALTEALKSKHDAQKARNFLAAAPSAEDTPPPPVSDSEGEVIGFPKGITYAAEITSSFPYGDTGETRNRLPGGVNGTMVARLEPRTNAFFEYFQLQPQIEGINNGSAPVYSLAGPTGSRVPASILNQEVASKIDAFVIGLQRLFFVGGEAINGGHPVVFAPTYTAVKGDIGGGDLNFQVQYNNGKVMRVQQRVFQQWEANLAIPLSLTEKLTVLYIATGEILVHPDGFNETNHPQFEQQLLVEYTPNKQTTIFVNPSKALTYFPTDTYPVSTANFVYGINHKFGKPNKARLQPYIQGEVIESNPDNPILNQNGIAKITAVPGVGLLPAIGGNKFTTVQLSFGLGTPPVIIPYP